MQSTQSVRNQSSWAPMAEFDSLGNDITELIKTFRIGHAKIKRDQLKVIIGAVVDMSATLSGKPSLSSVEAAQHYGLYYREIGLLFEKSNGWSKEITSSVYQVLCTEPDMTDSKILHEIRRNSDAGYQFFSGAEVVGFYHPSANLLGVCSYQSIA